MIGFIVLAFLTLVAAYVFYFKSTSPSNTPTDLGSSYKDATLSGDETIVGGNSTMKDSFKL